MAKENPLKEAAKRLKEDWDWPVWKIAQQLKVSEATIVKWLKLK